MRLLSKQREVAITCRNTKRRNLSWLRVLRSNFYQYELEWSQKWNKKAKQLGIKATGSENKQCTESDVYCNSPSRPTQSTQEGRHSSKKPFYLLNTPSGLFITVVHGTHLLESPCPPSCLLRSGKSKWLFCWMRNVKALGQIAGTNRACCFTTICWEAVGVVYH